MKRQFANLFMKVFTYLNEYYVRTELYEQSNLIFI